MPIRFSTEAANADVLGEDTKIGATPDATPRGSAASRTRPDRFDRPPKPDKRVDAPGGDVKPGKDINAPGFIKDKDASKP
jgi:hypothetical protein